MRHRIIEWWNSIFSYPQEKIAAVPLSHDSYWEHRGTHASSGLSLPSAWQKQRADFVLKTIGNQKSEGLVIADIGSGNGATLRYLKQSIPLLKGVGVDGSKVMLEEVQRSGFTAVEADVADASFIVPPSDYALLFEIVEHVPLSEALIENALKSARRGVFVSFPNSGFFTYRLRLLFGRFPVQWLFHPSEHVRFWTLMDMRWWLRACGWENATVRGYEGVPLLNTFLPSLFAAGIIVYIPKSS